MNDWDIAVASAQMAPEWLYQRALESMIAEEKRIAECTRMGVIGYDLAGGKSRSESSGQTAGEDSERS